MQAEIIWSEEQLFQFMAIARMGQPPASKVGTTNGCFDVLHAGHLQSLNRMADQVGLFLVLVNSDRSIQDGSGTLNKPNRPVIPEVWRMAALAELRGVDAVVLMDAPNPVSLLRIIKPDYHFKGEDWRDKYCPEQVALPEWGGRMVYMTRKHGISTTMLLENWQRRGV